MPGIVIVGGFAEVEQAILRASRFSKSGPLVAVKKLRPTGNRQQRIRVVAVSIVGVHAATTTNLYSVSSPRTSRLGQPKTPEHPSSGRFSF